MTNFTVVALANHLWQSTLFAGVLGCLTLLLRKNSARVRCLVWLAASAKFLVPFALLTAIGAQLPWPYLPNQGTQPAFLSIATQIGGEGATTLVRTAHSANYADMILIALEVLWAMGMIAVTARWITRWCTVRRALHESVPTNLAFVIPVRSSSLQLEPAVVGVLHPVLLLPEGMDRHLAADEMDAVLAHEHCHVMWRDNLAATVHMFVEALFWFHPLIWWLGTRIVDERERACDEQVLAQGHASRSYAEGILKVCELYLRTPLISVAGIGGANLSRRIEAIMKNKLIVRLGAMHKALLTLAASATIAIPLAIGALSAPPGRAKAATAEANVAALRNVLIQLAPPQSPFQAPGLYNAFGLMLDDGRRVQTVYSLRTLIASVYGVDVSQVLGKDLSKEPLYQITADNPWPETPTDSGEVRTARFRKSLNELPTLTRDLLASHFGLVVKRERRQMQGYVLTVGAGGSKLDADSDAPWWRQGEFASNQELIATQAPVGPILRYVAAILGTPVIDQTGLKVTYDYKLTWKRSLPGVAPEPAMLAKALEEQLGLHLEAKPVIVDVIDVVSLKSPQQVLTAR